MKRTLLAIGAVGGCLIVLGTVRETWRWKRFPGASARVVEIEPPGLERRTPFGPAPRVDRCATCHLGSVGPVATATEAMTYLLQPHPRPELFAGEGSPHPASSFGCTICHGGEGRATDFSRAGHWSADPATQVEWEVSWGFDRGALPPEPILPPALFEARCPACHMDAPASDTEKVDAGRISLERGRDLVERLGCAGCHSLGRESGGAPRPSFAGPPLDRLADSTTAGWAFRFIAAPRSFRTSSSMPHLFPPWLDPARRDVAIRAIVSFLWEPTGSYEPEELGAPPPGDADSGAVLFQTIGCTGCHVLGAKRRDAPPSERLHGPDLVLTGNKLRPAWLYAWLKNPRAVRPTARMPDLRLSDQEAADLTAFLSASRDPVWDDLELPPIDALLRDAMVEEVLAEELSAVDAAVRLKAMRSHDKELVLGRWAISTYGCTGCHAIAGLAPPGPVGAPLDELDARRLLASLGRREVEGSALAHRAGTLGSLPAPEYGLSRAEADAVLADLLSRQAAPVGASRRADNVDELAWGWHFLRRSGCMGCHRLAGRGGAIATAPEPPALAPPSLDDVGARYLATWLFAFLEHPERDVRRPWLQVRMPSYRLSTEEANAVVHFFASRDAQPLLTGPPRPPTQADLEVGQTVTAILNCSRCHAGEAPAAGLEPETLAPRYAGAASRLRPSWVVSWILDPDARFPGTAMPTTFTRRADGGRDASFLPSTLQAPMFENRTRRLLEHFASEDELWAYLGDAERVAMAVRDHLWTLEIHSRP